MNEINKIGVVGAGQMGRGIAQVAAFSGFEVFLFDVNKEALDFGLEFIKKQLDRGVAKEKWDQKTADETLTRITGVTNLEDMSDVDLAIEAATENKKIKFEIFKSLDEKIQKNAILATNTSSISIKIFP